MTNQSQVTIRDASAGDLPALTDIYNYYVLNTAVTFDVDLFTPETRRPWFDQFAPGSAHQLIVLESGAEVLGYASSARLRPKQAYETSVEVSIYLRNGTTGNGYGRLLYSALFERLAEQDIHRCYGIITIPNDASLALHRAFEFVEVAHLHEVGRKFDRYWDTVWLEKSL